MLVNVLIHLNNVTALPLNFQGFDTFPEDFVRSGKFFAYGGSFFHYFCVLFT